MRTEAELKLQNELHSPQFLISLQLNTFNTSDHNNHEINNWTNTYIITPTLTLKPQKIVTQKLKWTILYAIQRNDNSKNKTKKKKRDTKKQTRNRNQHSEHQLTT